MASSSSRDKLIERVRALLAMTTANGCTEAEAMTAAAMAARLMQEYDLDLKDVSALKDERVAQQSKPFASDERPREMHAAGIYVAVAIGEFFDCKCWRTGTEIIFFGLKDDVPLAHAMLAMIRVAMDSELATFLLSDAAKNAAHQRVLASSFLKGMGYRISARIRALKAERTTHVRSAGRDLVVVKGAIVDAAFADLFGSIKWSKPKPLKPPRDSAAFAAGEAAANRVRLGIDTEIAAQSVARRSLGVPAAVRRSPYWQLLIPLCTGLRALLLSAANIIMLTGFVGLIPAIAIDTYAAKGRPFADRWPTFYVDLMPFVAAPFAIMTALVILASARSNHAAFFAKWRTLITETHDLCAAGRTDLAWRHGIMVQHYQQQYTSASSALSRLKEQADALFWSLLVYLGYQLGPVVHNRLIVPNEHPDYGSAVLRLLDPIFVIGHIIMGLECVVLASIMAAALWPMQPPVRESKCVAARCEALHPVQV